MSSATVEERARKKAERKLEKQRQAAAHDLPRSMRPSAAVKTLTVVLLVLVLIYFLFPIYWAIIASTKTPAQMTGSNGMWFAVPLGPAAQCHATNYSKQLGIVSGNFWRLGAELPDLLGRVGIDRHHRVCDGWLRHLQNSTPRQERGPSASLWPACSCRPPC